MDQIQLPVELQPELYLLICRFLDNGPCREAADLIRRQLDRHELLPRRVDWLGNQHATSWRVFEERHLHITHDFLPRVLARVSTLLDKQIPASGFTSSSLLGAGSQSLLRFSSDIVHRNETHFLNAITNHAPRQTCASRMHLFPPNIVSVITARENCGPRPVTALLPTQLYDRFIMYRRFLGHLSCVYCVSFDRSGRYIFTGADDMLIKIWSAVDGRLLATLRGHAAEITDIAVNYENTLVAAGSCDKMIRVWCIKTTQPICVLTGHSGMITSVRFCPDSRNRDRYLVSTSSDGTVCFWTWNVKTRQFNLNPQKLTERIKQGAQLICFSFSTGGAFLAVGSSDHYVRVYHVSAAGGPAKVLEIQPHIDQVDSLQFSNLGLRFISGSKDGTANIWSFERQEWHNRTLQMSQVLSADNVNDNVQENKTKLKVTMVGWSSDDAYVITAVNDHSIKVWEPNTGTLKYVLREHEDEVFVIEAHPTDPRIFLSGGHDGRIILWDLTVGKKIKMFYNQIEGQGYGAIFDCKWSPDGQMFASTDSHGHITIYGMGDRSRYMRVPDEVFFHTDYRPLIRDANHYVIDEQTQCAPHLMGPPFLVDIDGNPYPPHLQRLVPGREHCKDDQLVPYIAIQNERGVAEILEPRQEPPPPAPLPPPPPPPEPVAQVPASLGPTIDDMIVRLQQEQAVRSTPRVGEPAQGEPSGSSSHPALRRSGEVEGVRQSSGNWQSRSGPLRGIRQYVQPLDKASLNRIYQQIEGCCAWEEQSYLRELKRKPLTPSANANREDLERQRLTRRKKRLQQQRQGIRPTARQNNRVLRADPEVELSDPSIDSSNNEEDWMDSESSTSESSEEEWVSEDPRNRKKRTRTQRHAVVESDSDDDHHRRTNGHRYNSDEPSTSGLNGRARRNRRQVNGNSNRSERRSNRNRDQPRPSTSGAGSSSPSSSSATSSASSLPEAPISNGVLKKADIPSDYRYPEWLTEVKPRRTPYFPQIGDDVVYFRKGHELYVEAVSRQKLYPINSRPQPLNRKTVKDQQLVKVLDIEYEIRSPRLVKLKLACLDEETNQQTGETFVLKYHDMPDVIDFLVLHQYYVNSIQRKWQVQNRFRAIVDDRWWFGRIVSIESESPEDQFQMYKILWDSGEEELMSPWDLETIDNRSPAIDGQEILPEELQQLMYVPNESAWDDMNPDYQCERLIHGLEKIMETSWAEIFNAPVDLNEYPDYATMIAYPIDLNTIKERLNNRFYRSIDAVRFDVKFIQNNAQLYNLPHSMITRNARLVTALCLQFIERFDCQDPTVIQHEIQQNKEMYESTDSEFEERESGRRSTRRNNSTAPNWVTDCKKLLHVLFHNVNSEPFREPIDLQEYPDYLTVVTTPMDLSTIREQLNAGVYTHPKDMMRDLKLVFTNSKLYNTNKQSPIFKMTCVLQPVAMDAMNQILADFKNQNMNTKPKTTAPVRKRGRTNGTVSEDQLTTQPSTSGYRSKTQNATGAPSTSNGYQVKSSRYATRKSEERNVTLMKGRNGRVGSHADEDTDDEEFHVQTKFVNGNRRTRLQTRSTRTSRPPKRYHESDNEDETEEEEEELEEQPSIETEDEEADETEVDEDDEDEEEEEDDDDDDDVESDGYQNGANKRKRNGHFNQSSNKRAKMSNGHARTRQSNRHESSSTSVSAAASDSETNCDTSATEVDSSPAVARRSSRRGSQTSKRTANNQRASTSSGSTRSPASVKASRSKRQTRRKPINYTEDFDQDEQDESDYEYELGGFKNVEEMSSRGRRRKLKGQARSIRSR